MRKILFPMILVFMGSCTQKTITNKDMTGKYSVHLELDEKTFDKQGIRDSVAQAISKAKDELSKAKVDFDLKMDTSTAEGKMEYYAKSFAKTMSSFGKDLGELGILMGEAAGDVAVSAMEMTENLVQHIKMDVELKEDGTIATDSNLVNNIQFSGTKWETKDNVFILKDEDGKTKHEYKITDESDKGFVLAQDKYRLVFEKTANESK
jgi:hypothetical protein